MAGAFKEAVLTSKGAALLAKAQASRCAIAFTKAVSGNGAYSDGESLISRTALKSQKQSFAINKLFTTNDTTAVVKFIVANKTDTSTLTAGYYVTEVGVYATDPDAGEILYGIAVVNDEHADYLPAYNNVYPSTLTVNFEIEVAHASSVSIVGGAGGYVSEVDFDALQESIDGETKPFAGLKDTAEATALLANRLHHLIDAVADIETDKVEDTDFQEAMKTLNQTIDCIINGETPFWGLRDIGEAVALLTNRVRQLNDEQDELGTVTLTNTQEYPFNNSVKTVALTKQRSADYMVVATITGYSGGLPGEIHISDRAMNGFKVSFDGSAKSVTIDYAVKGGHLS